MAEDQELIDLKSYIYSLPELTRKHLFGGLVRVLELKIGDLDAGWQEIDLFDPNKIWRLQVIVDATKKKTYQEILIFLDQFIHPEPEEGETPTESWSPDESESG